MGYHNLEIEKGELGKISKIEEEFNELIDAHNQNNPILILCELADLIGAIELYANNWNISLEDVIKMTNATKSAFKDGSRK